MRASNGVTRVVPRGPVASRRTSSKASATPRRCAVCGVRHCCVDQFGDAHGRRYHDQRLKIAGRRLATPRRVFVQHGDDRQLFILDSTAHPLDQSCQWRRVAAGVDDHEVRSGRRAPDASGCVIRIASAPATTCPARRSARVSD